MDSDTDPGDPKTYGSGFAILLNIFATLHAYVCNSLCVLCRAMCVPLMCPVCGVGEEEYLSLSLGSADLLEQLYQLNRPRWSGRPHNHNLGQA
jgi:hypothetical protein